MRPPCGARGAPRVYAGEGRQLLSQRGDPLRDLAALEHEAALRFVQRHERVDVAGVERVGELAIQLLRG